MHWDGTEQSTQALPVAAGAVTCGNRLDRFRKQRIHHWSTRGTDVRHMHDGSFAEVVVSVCTDCGKESWKTP